MLFFRRNCGFCLWIRLSDCAPLCDGRWDKQFSLASLWTMQIANLWLSLELKTVAKMVECRNWGAWSAWADAMRFIPNNSCHSDDKAIWSQFKNARLILKWTAFHLKRLLTDRSKHSVMSEYTLFKIGCASASVLLEGRTIYRSSVPFNLDCDEHICLAFHRNSFETGNARESLSLLRTTINADGWTTQNSKLPPRDRISFSRFRQMFFFYSKFKREIDSLFCEHWAPQKHEP